MATQLIRASGIAALNMATRLLQRVRLADNHAGVFEAADIQWSWREPRRSDDMDKLFWMDEHGPVAGVWLTSWRDGSWQCDPFLVPGSPGIDPAMVWKTMLAHVSTLSLKNVTIPVSSDDHFFLDLTRQSGFTPGDSDSTAWLNPADRPEVRELPDSFILVDRTERHTTPHHMRSRNGDGIAERLEQCSLYDPSLDLAIESAEGQIAGYSLYWFDPVTKVGLVEPVRVEEAFQRRGLATTMLTAGIDRLVQKGARRIKVSFETEAAGALYKSVGFQKTSSTTWFHVP